MSTIYMIPVPIAENALQTLSPEVAQHTLRLKHYVVEHARTARRLIKALHPSMVIEELQFSEIDKHAGLDAQLVKQWIKAGHDIGVMSEAGCPGVADPGADIAGVAHSMGAKVVPLVGPSSLILALMASGLNGQSFAFNGYLPVKDSARNQRIRALEQHSTKERQTQLFIETPYRNAHLLADLIKHCRDTTRICIAMNLNTPEQYIKTQTIAQWKKSIPTLGKFPAVFLMLG